MGSLYALPTFRSSPNWLVTDLFCCIDNVDYDEIKSLIKAKTSANNAVPVSIPGQNAEPESWKQFEDEIFELLQDQHRRVSLFARSKYGEMERRLGSNSDGAALSFADDILLQHNSRNKSINCRKGLPLKGKITGHSNIRKSSPSW